MVPEKSPPPARLVFARPSWATASNSTQNPIQNHPPLNSPAEAPLSESIVEQPDG